MASTVRLLQPKVRPGEGTPPRRSSVRPCSLRSKGGASPCSSRQEVGIARGSSPPDFVGAFDLRCARRPSSSQATGRRTAYSAPNKEQDFCQVTKIPLYRGIGPSTFARILVVAPKE